MRGQGDDVQLAFLTDQGRVLFTANAADFCNLDRQWRLAERHHAGIIVLTDQRTPVGVQLRAFDAIAQKLTSEEMEEQAEVLAEPQVERIRTQ